MSYLDDAVASVDIEALEKMMVAQIFRTTGIVAEITAAVRAADVAFESGGGAVRRVVAERDALRATNAELVEVLGRLSEMCLPASRLSTTRGQDALFCARAAAAKVGVQK